MRTQEGHALAVGARGHEQNCGFFACLLGQKSMASGFKKRISSHQSHRWNKARRIHWILTYGSPQQFVNASDAGITGLFCGYFKTYITFAFPRKKNQSFPEPHL
jgi:hypothetical protein